MIYLFLYFFLSVLVAGMSSTAVAHPIGQITAPIVDVRAFASKKACGTHGYHDFHQTTQLLWGEYVRVHAKKNGWVSVEIPEQKIFCRKQKKLLSCSGWIEERFVRQVKELKKPTGVIKHSWVPLFTSKNASQKPFMHICLGTMIYGFLEDQNWWKIETPEGKSAWIESKHIRPLCKKMHAKRKRALRKAVVKDATLFVGHPYRWGGRSFFLPLKNQSWIASSVDCASLVHLLYQSYGILVPRNSTGLYHAAKAIAGKECLPGDLIFTSRSSSPHDIYHVLLYLGDDMLLEAVGESGVEHKKVRMISAVNRFGQTLSQLKNGQHLEKCSIFFGTFLA